jgi:hypothetical protein
MNQLRCAIYTRFSSDRQSPTSITDQIRKCREHAQRNGWLVLEEHLYSDEAISGASTDRAGLQRLLSAVAGPSIPFDCILIGFSESTPWETATIRIPANVRRSKRFKASARRRVRREESSPQFLVFPSKSRLRREPGASARQRAKSGEGWTKAGRRQKAELPEASRNQVDHRS